MFAFRYHDQTKHYFNRLARSLGYLDWAAHDRIRISVGDGVSADRVCRQITDACVPDSCRAEGHGRSLNRQYPWLLFHSA